MTSSRDFDTNHGPTDEQETRLFRERARNGRSEACLVVIGGARLGTRVLLDRGGEVVIGRDPASDFQIAERSVSRKHCQVIVDQNRHWIEDLESTNHTYLNGRRIERAPLSDGDQIRICETTLKFIDAGNIEAEYHSELHESTIRDPLTGLFNRRHAMAVLDTEVARARRDSSYQLSIVILDIDYFKPLNDDLGHLAGDRALKRLSKLLSARIRAGDTLARIGGEEFMLIAPDTPS
ncbi:MAG: GGDEF domain-containing protein, partial [Wenzhouxiangellaceae bacterium]